jgi:methylglutaconyl-CoA hydratase
VTRAGVATLVLNRPEKHNAMSARMIAELREAAAELAPTGGAGRGADRGRRSFCAGGDLGWMQAQMAADAATRGAEAGQAGAALGALNSCRSR